MVKAQIRSLAFGGSVAGDSVTYTPTVTFNSSDELRSEAINTLPTKTGEKVTILVYKGSDLIGQVSEDNNGNDITLSPGDDKSIVIDLLGMSLQTNSWNQYAQKTEIY